MVSQALFIFFFPLLCFSIAVGCFPHRRSFQKKKYIDKKKATTFVVLNRGADATNATEKVFQPVKPPNFPRDQKWTPQMTLDDEESNSDGRRDSDDQEEVIFLRRKVI